VFTVFSVFTVFLMFSLVLLGFLLSCHGFFRLFCTISWMLSHLVSSGALLDGIPLVEMVVEHGSQIDHQFTHCHPQNH
jgi:hypothetical protein